MKTSCQSFFFYAAGLLVFAAAARAKSDLNSPEQRRDFVNGATALVQPQTPAPLPPDLNNPFAPAHGKSQQVADKDSHRPVGDHAVLAAIASRISPSGVMQGLDGLPMLLLGEKKLKVGDYLTITFEGADYMVELASIDHSSFTLRLNKEEVTQPINH